MFGMSMTEVIIIAVLAVVLVGPDDLSKAAQTIGRTVRRTQLPAVSASDFAGALTAVLLVALIALLLVRPGLAPALASWVRLNHR